MADQFMPGEYSVEVKAQEETIVTWTGYADNPSDALYWALDAVEEQIAKESRRE